MAKRRVKPVKKHWNSDPPPPAGSGSKEHDKPKTRYVVAVGLAVVIEGTDASNARTKTKALVEAALKARKDVDSGLCEVKVLNGATKL